MCPDDDPRRAEAAEQIKAIREEIAHLQELQSSSAESADAIPADKAVSDEK